MRPTVEFSEDVVANVLAAVGGKTFNILLYRFQQEFNRLKRTERAGGFDREFARRLWSSPHLDLPKEVVLDAED
jgi:hypothetical protein